MAGGVGQMFIKGTRYAALGPSDQAKGLPQPPLEMKPSTPILEVMNLPEPETVALGDLPVREAVDRRRSLRIYTNQPLTLEAASYLLWCTQGVKEITPRPVTLRTVPSAGARHPLETVLLINRVEGLASGLYWFAASERQLARLETDPSIAERMREACLGQEMVQRSAITFVWIADAYRCTWRYGERGYRYLFLDAGHVCQNLYLAAEAIDCGVCAIGAFSDEAINRLLNLDGQNQFVVYLAAVGKRKE